MQKKLKYASYTMGGCSDLAVDIKMDGQDKINHSCKVYRSFFGLVVQVWMQKLVKDGRIAVLEHRKKEEMNSCSGFNPLRPLFFLL